MSGDSYSMNKPWMCAGLAIAGLASMPAAAGNNDTARPPVEGELSRWVVEQQPGGTVTVKDGVMVIDDAGGCTVWWREKLKAPVKISYRARVGGGERVSDLNCFWMATDPRAESAGGTGADGGFFSKGNGRDGVFAHYDGLKTYYVGCGGNGNTTTRFRRYDGKGARPLLPEHDKKDKEALLEGGREYRIEIVVTKDGRTTWARDGVVFFDYTDAEPLKEGWFGLRTVWSRIEVREFKVEGL